MVGWPPVRAFRKNIVRKSSKYVKVGVDGTPYLRKVDLQMYNTYQHLLTALGDMFTCFTIREYIYIYIVNLILINFQYNYIIFMYVLSFLNIVKFDLICDRCSGEVLNERKLIDPLSGTEYVPTYEDKDGDWMLVGDVPWEMFIRSCKRLRIIKGSEAKGLGYL